MKKFLVLAALLLSTYVFAQNPPLTHWEFAGWFGGGCHPSVAFDPTVKDRVYLTSDVAGIWRSDDKGDNWYFVTEGLGNLNVAAVAIAPSDSNVLYAATASGLFISRNAASSWTKTDTLKNKILFSRPASYRPIAIDPADPMHVCAGTVSGQVFCSKDGGQRWEDLDPERKVFTEKSPIAVVKFDGSKALFASSAKGLNRCDLEAGKCEFLANGPTRITDFVLTNMPVAALYAAGSAEVWISTDKGTSWSQSKPIPKGQTYRISVAQEGEKEDITAMRIVWNKDWYGGVLISRDAGQTWDTQDRNLNGDVKADPTRLWADKGGRSNSVEVDPFNWKTVFRTDWWGAWRSDDAGVTWYEKINGAPNSVATQVALGPTGNVYVSSMDNGLLQSRDSGKNYECLFPVKYAADRTGHVWRVAVNGERIIATSSPWNKAINQVILSSDAGKTFSLITQGLPEARPKKNTMWGQGYPRALAVDPKNPQNVYLGIDGDDGGGLFISNDGARTWRRSSGQPKSLKIYNGLAVDPTDGKRLVWGTCGKDGGVYVSQDSGQSFKYTLSQMQCVFDVAAGGDGVLYAAGSTGDAKLYASFDQGQNWKLIGNFGVGTLGTVVVDPQNPKRLAVSTVKWNGEAPSQIYISDDQGDKWQNVTGDLPYGSGASSITFDPGGKYLYIARYAGSVWRMAL